MTAPDLSSSTSAYVQQTIDLLGRHDPLVVLDETPAWLRNRITGLDAEALGRPEGAGQWSITQVLAHLADTEVALGWRARITLTQEHAPLHGFDEGAWVTRFDYAGADPAQALSTFAALRAWNLRVWRSAGAADLTRVAIHSERGPESFDTLRRMSAGHDLRHRRQVDRILASFR